MLFKRAFVCLVVALFLVSCQILRDEEYLPPAMPVDVPLPEANVGTIYRSGVGVNLYQDPFASKVGDVLTIRLEEATKGTYSAKTKTQKNQTLDYPTPTLFGQPAAAMDISSATKQILDSKGDTAQSNALTGMMSVTVIRVLSNKNLVVQGETWVTINQGTETIQLTGIVRPIDIEPGNIISSQRIAGAQIKYGARGEAGYATRGGLIFRLFSRYMPY
jgi:flagellar L-ring protein FlgH